MVGLELLVADSLRQSPSLPSLSLSSYFPFNVTKGKINGAKCLFVSWPWFPNERTLSDLDETLDFDCYSFGRT